MINNTITEMIYKYLKIDNIFLKMIKEHLEVNRNYRYL